MLQELNGANKIKAFNCYRYNTMIKKSKELKRLLDDIISSSKYAVSYNVFGDKDFETDYIYGKATRAMDNLNMIIRQLELADTVEINIDENKGE